MNNLLFLVFDHNKKNDLLFKYILDFGYLNDLPFIFLYVIEINFLHLNNPHILIKMKSSKYSLSLFIISSSFK
jgi:hypothetical protein